MRISLLFSGLLVLSLAGCLREDDPNKQLTKDIDQINKYVAAKSLNVQTTTSGMRYVITNEGTGTERPTVNDRVVIRYKGELLNGTVFSQIAGENSEIYPVTVLISGLAEAVQLQKRGGRGTFLLPSALAFGTTGTNNVSPNTPVVFDLELVDFFPSTDAGQAAYDKKVIENYLKQKNITNAQQTASGLYYVIQTEGSGANPTLQSTVTVRYRGQLLNGTIFDQTSGEAGTSFGLLNVIKGWQEGLQLMKKGGRATFFIPSGLGYGAQGAGSGRIPAHSVLIFEVELLDFK